METIEDIDDGTIGDALLDLTLPEVVTKPLEFILQERPVNPTNTPGCPYSCTNGAYYALLRRHKTSGTYLSYLCSCSNHIGNMLEQASLTPEDLHINREYYDLD